MSNGYNGKSNLDKDGFYVIENYDKKAPFASFLSAIAGVEGIPMWSFYVNRGQVISSIGIKDKGNSIMEFFPANEAYKMVYTNGFRTFIKIKNNINDFVYEPFAVNSSKELKRDLKIKNNEIQIIEDNKELSLTIKVKYFTVPNESFAAMARKVEIINNSDKDLEIEVLDGIAAILPYGTDYLGYKQMSNLLRSWMEASISENGAAKYKLRTSTADTAEVEQVTNSYFYVAMDGNEEVLRTVVDAEKVFGFDTSLREPVEFNNNSVTQITEKQDVCVNKVPCAFATKDGQLKAGRNIEIYSYIGFIMGDKEEDKVINKVCNKEYFNSKTIEGNLLIDEITKTVETKTAYPMFDEYVKQCYVDNVLRGGYPIEFGQKNKKVYYVYSRKHGDLERDYNFFTIEPNYYSQGNGNFRDINQNRRMDVYLHPFVGTENIKLFMNLIQMDGYNPLVIKGKKFTIDKSMIQESINRLQHNDITRIDKVIDGDFTLGELVSAFKNLDEEDEKLKEAILAEIVEYSKDNIDAEFGEGFWVDHWTYNLDLIEEYINIYPDKINTLLIEDKEYKFYNSPEYVLPRKDRYVLNSKGQVRQYVSLEKKNTKNKWLHDINGELYTTSLYSKLFMLASVKFMALDPFGIGIEMEAGKPGWNDAMNGLPGLIGASTPELFELKRLLLFLKKYSDNVESLQLPKEFYNAVIEINNTIIEKFNYGIKEIEYWENINDIKESYRNVVKDVISGEDKDLNTVELSQIIDNMISKIDDGINKLNGLNKEVIPTFLYYDVTEYDVLENEAKKYIIPKKFEVNYLPHFLEGPTRYLKTNLALDEKKKIYSNIKNTGIYDKKLKMYKTSESLEDTTFEIGRARGFTAGWLERESVFMHMEYKYILELLKNGLYEEFFENIETVLPPFMNADVYGRSILENSSFIASSANPDNTTHGRGFVARLTGTTVEMLNMWQIMMGGKELFTYNDNELIFKLTPVLPSKFFKEENIVETKILGGTSVIYYNPNRKNTFGVDKSIINEMNIKYRCGKEIIINGDVIIGQVANDIREGKVNEIRVSMI